MHDNAKTPQAQLYGNTLANHYKAYRPPLHELILKRLLAPNTRFEIGVDVGCGTGYSSKALAPYCKHVYGVEPSQAMLSRALTIPNVSYQEGSAENLGLPDSCADIVTYAGVLFYTNIRHAAAELRRICKKHAQVLVYDFSVLYAPFIKQHRLQTSPSASTYNHRCNFAGIPGFKNDAATTERIAFQVQAPQLAHLLLSEPHLYQAYTARYNTQTPYDFLKHDLEQAHESYTVGADIFYTVYEM